MNENKTGLILDEVPIDSSAWHLIEISLASVPDSTLRQVEFITVQLPNSDGTVIAASAAHNGAFETLDADNPHIEKTTLSPREAVFQMLAAPPDSVQKLHLIARSQMFPPSVLIRFLAADGSVLHQNTYTID